MGLVCDNIVGHDNTLRSKQNGCDCADVIVIYIFENKCFYFDKKNLPPSDLNALIEQIRKY